MSGANSNDSTNFSSEESADMLSERGQVVDDGEGCAHKLRNCRTRFWLLPLLVAVAGGVALVALWQSGQFWSSSPESAPTLSSVYYNLSITELTFPSGSGRTWKDAREITFPDLSTSTSIISTIGNTSTEMEQGKFTIQPPTGLCQFDFSSPVLWYKVKGTGSKITVSTSGPYTTPYPRRLAFNCGFSGNFSTLLAVFSDLPYEHNTSASPASDALLYCLTPATDYERLINGKGLHEHTSANADSDFRLKGCPIPEDEWQHSSYYSLGAIPPTQSYLAEYTWDSVLHRDYYVAIGGLYLNQTGAFRAIFYSNTNGICQNAIPLTVASSKSASLGKGATNTSGTTLYPQEAWFTVQGTGGVLVLSEARSHHYKNFQIFSGSCQGLHPENGIYNIPDIVPLMPWEASYNKYTKSVAWQSRTNETYFVRLKLTQSIFDYQIAVYEARLEPNNECTSAIHFSQDEGHESILMVDQSTRYAFSSSLLSDAVPVRCRGGSYPASRFPAVWYSFTGTGQIWTVSMDAYDFHVGMTILKADNCTQFYPVEYELGTGGFSNKQKQAWWTDPGQNYYIVVGACSDWYGASGGTFNLSLQESNPYSNKNIFCDLSKSVTTNQTYPEIHQDDTDSSTVLLQTLPPYNQYADCEPIMRDRGSWFEVVATSNYTQVVLSEKALVSIFVGNDCKTRRCIGGYRKTAQGNYAWRSRPGDRFYVLIHRHYKEKGLSFHEFLPTKQNSFCDDAMELQTSAVHGSTNGTLTEHYSGETLWHKMHGEGKLLNLTVLVSRDDYQWYDFDFHPSLWFGSCRNLTRIYGMAFYPDCSSLFACKYSAIFYASANQTYFIAIRRHEQYSGNASYSLLLEHLSMDARNDKCKNAKRVLAHNQSQELLVGSPLNGTFAPILQCNEDHQDYGEVYFDRGVWYSLKGAGAVMDLHMNSNSPRPLVLKTEESLCGNLQCVSPIKYPSNVAPFSDLHWYADSSAEYRIFVHSYYKFQPVKSFNFLLTQISLNVHCLLAEKLMVGLNVSLSYSGIQFYQHRFYTAIGTGGPICASVTAHQHGQNIEVYQEMNGTGYTNAPTRLLPCFSRPGPVANDLNFVGSQSGMLEHCWLSTLGDTYYVVVGDHNATLVLNEGWPVVVIPGSADLASNSTPASNMTMTANQFSDATEEARSQQASSKLEQTGNQKCPTFLIIESEKLIARGRNYYVIP